VFLDTSAIIAYIAEINDVVDYVDSAGQLLTSTICLSEYLNGRAQQGYTDMQAERAHLPGVRVVPFSEPLSMESGRIQARLMDHGKPMANRDLMIFTTAAELNEELIVVDSDFEVPGSIEEVTVTCFPS